MRENTGCKQVNIIKVLDFDMNFGNYNESIVYDCMNEYLWASIVLKLWRGRATMWQEVYYLVLLSDTHK